MEEDSKTYRASIAGRRYLHFLLKLNSGNLDEIRKFIIDNFDSSYLATHPVSQIADQCMQIYRETGGLAVSRVYFTEEYYVIIIAKGKNDNLYLDKLKITPEKPYNITLYIHEPLPEGLPEK